MAKSYTLNTYTNEFGQVVCLIEFLGMGLGNTYEAERIANNSMRQAKKAIRNLATQPPQTRNAYEVVANSFTLGGGQLKTLTIAKKQKEGKQNHE